jgi:DNA-directed RNA polymerase subunit K/omega
MLQEVAFDPVVERCNTPVTIAEEEVTDIVTPVKEDAAATRLNVTL